MAVDEDEDNNSGCDATDEPQDVVMNNGELEVGKNDKEDESEDDSKVEDSNDYDYEEDDMEGVKYGDGYNKGNEGGSGGSDKESACGSDGEEDSYWYASPYIIQVQILFSSWHQGKWEMEIVGNNMIFP